MIFTRRLCALLLLALLLLPLSTISQELDGPTHIFRDTLLDNMTGAWNLTGKVMGRDATHVVQAEWVLNHQFFRIHEKDNTSTNVKVSYEAMVMIGYDNASDRYVVHWTDVYGGRFSETLGYGSQVGDEIRLVFEYPDGPFHTTFRWLPDARRWQWRMQSRDKTGKWVDFADLTLTRLKQS
ncbi:MAG TPA: DUF1579 family protein [Verrucomicrobiae bacterium]|nr:DUF1579 family protein [Verrucomicrobiae bacterium]